MPQPTPIKPFLIRPLKINTLQTQQSICQESYSSDFQSLSTQFHESIASIPSKASLTSSLCDTTPQIQFEIEKQYAAYMNEHATNNLLAIPIDELRKKNYHLMKLIQELRSLRQSFKFNLHQIQSQRCEIKRLRALKEKCTNIEYHKCIEQSQEQIQQHISKVNKAMKAKIKLHVNGNPKSELLRRREELVGKMKLRDRHGQKMEQLDAKIEAFQGHLNEKSILLQKGRAIELAQRKQFLLFDIDRRKNGFILQEIQINQQIQQLKQQLNQLDQSVSLITILSARKDSQANHKLIRRNHPQEKQLRQKPKQQNRTKTENPQIQFYTPTISHKNYMSNSKQVSIPQKMKLKSKVNIELMRSFQSNKTAINQYNYDQDHSRNSLVGRHMIKRLVNLNIQEQRRSRNQSTTGSKCSK